MKKICGSQSTLLLVLALSFCSVFAFGIIRANAGNSPFYDIFYSAEAHGSGGGFGQTFQAPAGYSNITEYKFVYYELAPSRAYTTTSFRICEVSSLDNTLQSDCLSTAYQQNFNMTFVGQSQVITQDVVLTSPFTITAGHYYMIYIDGWAGYFAPNEGNEVDYNNTTNTVPTKAFDSYADGSLKTIYSPTDYIPLAQIYGDEIPTGTVNTDDIYAFGWPSLWSNPTVFQHNGPKKFPLYWNVCSNYANLNGVYITENLNGSSLGQYRTRYVVEPKDKFIGPQQCKGNFVWEDDYDTTESGTALFTLTEDNGTQTPIILTSNTINYITASSTNYIDNAMNDPLMIDLGSLPQGVQTSTSTSLFFLYNFTGEDYASSTVCLWDYRHATSTSYCTTGPFNATSTGLGTIVIPTPASSTSILYKFYGTIPGSPTLWSDIFSVVWSFQPIAKTVCQPPQFDYSHMCDGLDPGSLIGQMTCSLKVGITFSAVNMFTPDCDSLTAFTDNYNKFKKSFPFNTYFNLTDSINTAIDTGSSSTSTPGVFSIPFIHKASSTYYMLPVMSSSSMSNAIGSSNVNIYLTTLGYIYWILGAVAVYFTVRKI